MQRFAGCGVDEVEPAAVCACDDDGAHVGEGGHGGEHFCIGRKLLLSEGGTLGRGPERGGGENVFNRYVGVGHVHEMGLVFEEGDCEFEGI